ncbi:DUF1552 domain-containing protein [bacterium]|nr:DUF1552 domain-containing protein [Rhodopirellula sp.]MDB4678733.1 DUF1552 domain-containing protein [Rhodopirellula sp.]MDC0278887.1 DUF1552 domain-containing protein [bacterium]MDC0295433.1 DUF1552 domain-containing protein [bacterium]
MKRHQIQRRDVLRGAGATLALPWMEAMGDPGDNLAPDTAKSVATNQATPQRVAFFYIPNGVVQSTWNPINTGPDFQLSPTLQPLESIREQTLVLSNLDRIKVPGTDGHAQASTCWLSSAAPDELSPAGYPLKRTIDQLIADHVGQQTAFRSLELSCNPFEDNKESIYFDNISWFGHGHVARSLRDPRKVFNRLFRVDQHTLSGSVLDLVAEDAKSLQPSLGKNDRRKLDEYTESVRAVELQIQRVRRRQGDIQKLNPQVPVKPWQSMTRNEFIQVMGDLMILALQTDLTRVASLMTAPERWSTPLKVEGWFDSPIEHHSWTHGQGNEHIRQELAKLDRFHVEQFVHLAKKMNAIQEGNRTLLENTMFVLGSGLSSGELHVYNNLPTIIAGSGGGAIHTGQHLRYAEGTPVANLWLTIASVMGVPIDRLGDSTGTLSNLKKS